MKWKFTIQSMTAIAVIAVLIPLKGAAQVTREPNVNITVTKTSELPQALVLSVHGACEASEDGLVFTKLKTGTIVYQGTVIRTDENARTDLFFRRIGTTVRLQSGTEVKLEKMARSIQDEKPVMETLIHVRKGRIFTVVRSLIEGSTFEIRNAAGRSTVGRGGLGRYIITADGSHVNDKKSVAQLKVNGGTGVTIIAPGETFSSKEGKQFALETPTDVATLIEFDELESLAEKLSKTD